MKYIIGTNKEEEDVSYFENFSNFTEEFDIDFYISGEWCFVLNLLHTINVPADMPIHQFLDECVKDVPPDSLINFYVTTREARYREWLDCVSGYPGGKITAIKRDGRTMFFCSVPTTPIFEENHE